MDIVTTSGWLPNDRPQVKLTTLDITRSRLFASAPPFVFPSTTHSFGNVLPKAMASPLPSRQQTVR